MNTTRIDLTQDAEEALEHWFQNNAPIWAAEGADVEEVKEDVQAHLMAEFADATEPINLNDIHGVLHSMGLPALGATTANHQVRFAGIPTSTAATEKQPRKRWIVRFYNTLTRNLFWVSIWPAAIIAFELLAHSCSGPFFDPLPT